MTAALAANEAGTAGDPLISRSYADGEYSRFVIEEPLEMLRQSMEMLKYKLSTATSGISLETVSAGSSFTVSAGGVFTVLTGSASVERVTGTLIDLGSGTQLTSGGQVGAGRQYLIGAGSSAAFKADSLLRLSVSSGTMKLVSDMRFTDISSGDWFYEYVRYAFTNGLVNGVSDTRYAPMNNLKISEAIKLAACMHQLYLTGSVTLVNGSATWYSTFVDYAKANGIITRNYPDYEQNITREEFVNIFYSALPAREFNEINSVADGAIPDVKGGDNYADRIYAFYRAGILVGNDEHGTFAPKSNIRRGEVAAIMTRMFEKEFRVQVTLS
jgi:hypothetical protein